MDTPSDVVGRVSALLSAVSRGEPDGLGTSELARSTGLPRPTAHRVLVSLQSTGMLDRDERGRWLLGPELFLLGLGAGRRYDVGDLARPYVERLAEVTGESAFFSLRRGDETVCLIREEGSFPIRSHVLEEGIRFPLGVASAGLAILAYLPEAEVQSYLARDALSQAYGAAHAPEALRERLTRTRQDGYALNPGLIVEGSWGIGAAVFDHHGAPYGAVSLTGIEQRFTPQRLKILGPAVLRTAHEVSRKLQDRYRLR